MSAPGRLETWGRLLRVPNLFTVPGDVVAGFLLATGGRLHWEVLLGVAAVLCLYAGGLLLNDYFDREVDARERPERPIPSGSVRARTVLAVGLALLAGGVAIASVAPGTKPCFIAAVVALAAFSYDAGLKRLRIAGPVVMGLCRAGSVALGGELAESMRANGYVVADYGTLPPGAAAGVAWVYTATLTMLAADEATGKPLGKKAFLPCGILAVGGCGMAMFLTPNWVMKLLAFVVLGVAIAASFRAARLACRRELPVPPFIGSLVRVMIPTQAAWSVWAIPLDRAPTAFNMIAGFGILWACAALSAERFYGS